MIYVALAEAVVIAVVVVTFGGLLRSRERSHARREDLMLDKLLHAVDKPWQPAPADTPAVIEPAEYEMPDWSAAPDQLPVY